MDWTENECLDLFVRRAEELLATRAVQDGAFSIEFSITAGINQPLTTMSKEPNEELLRSFLVTFRQFTMKGEPVFVDRIASIVWRSLRSDELKGRLEEVRAKWRQACRQGPMNVIINEERVTPADALDLWINGGYFHSEKRKVQAIDRLDPLGKLFSRHVFLNQLISATNYATWLAQLIVVARRQSVLD